MGDSLESDIKGGKENGFTTILVKTGNYRGEPITETTLSPDYIVEDVLDAVELIISH